MPPLPLTRMLQRALPRLSAEGRTVINTLGCYNGSYPSASDVAAIAGMPSRYHLARVLRREGLPPLVELGGWARALFWLFQAEATGASLRQLANHEGVPNATAYRLIRRVTGMPWTALRRAGLSVALLRLRDRCDGHSLGAPERPAGPGRPTGSRSNTGASRSSGARPLGQRPWVPRRLSSAVVASVGPAADVSPGRCAQPRHPQGVLSERLLLTGCPFDVAIGEREVACVTRLHAAAIEQIELAPFRDAGSVPTGSTPTRVAIRRAAAYVTNQFAEEIGILDLEQHQQVGAIALPGHPMGIALAPDGRTLFVTTNLDRLCAISLPRGCVLGVLPVPQVCTELTIDRSGRRIYVPTWRAGSILEVDARTLRSLRTFKVGGKVQDVAVSGDGLSMFAANEDGWVDVFHLGTGRHVARIEVGTLAFGLGLCPDETALYVTLLLAGKVAIVDRRALNVIRILETGGRPRRIAFDATGATALVANEAGWVDCVR